MTKKHNVIRYTSLPIGLGKPIWSTAVLWLLMDRLQPVAWLQGAVWTVWAILCIAGLYSWWTQELVDVDGFGEKTKQ